MRASHDEIAARRRERAAEIVRAWLLPGGACVPPLPGVKTVEATRSFVGESLYTYSVPQPVLATAGVLGALHALGAPCAEGGALVPTVDGGGMLWHGLHAVPLADDAETTTTRAKTEDDDGKAHDDTGDSKTAVGAGVLEVRAELGLPANDNYKDASKTLELAWDVPTYQAMVASGDEAQLRSAVHRAVYMGVQLRMQQEAPRSAKRAKAE